MGLISKAKKAASKAVQRSTTGLKYVGGTGAHLLGSDNTFADFDRGIDRLVRGKVSQKDLNKAWENTEQFVAGAPAGLANNVGHALSSTVDAAGQAVGDVASEATEGLGEAIGRGLEGAVKGLFGFGQHGLDSVGGKLLRAGLVVGAVVVTGGVAYVIWQNAPHGRLARAVRRAA